MCKLREFLFYFDHHPQPLAQSFQLEEIVRAYEKKAFEAKHSNNVENEMQEN